MKFLFSVLAAALVSLLTSSCGVIGFRPPVTVTVGSPSAGVLPRTGAGASVDAPARPTGPKRSIDGDGTYLVGTDVLAGTYRTSGSSGCYWARLSSLDTSDIIDNNNSSGQQVVDILPTDRAFLTSGCPPWNLLAGSGVPPAVAVQEPPVLGPIPPATAANPTQTASGDLAVSSAPTYPPCTPPTGVVVVGSAVDPTSYAKDVQRQLDAHPGALWLRTDRSCSSLRHLSNRGNAIFMVYRLAGSTADAICAAVRSEGGDAYGKWMDTVHDPGYIVPC